MTKLKRTPDGFYSGTYKGQAFRVWKEGAEEQGRSGYRWSARSGSIEVRTFLGGTRDEAVREVCRRLDMAEVSVPEVDALLSRWAEEISAIVPLLNENDAHARSRASSNATDRSRPTPTCHSEDKHNGRDQTYAAIRRLR